MLTHYATRGMAQYRHGAKVLVTSAIWIVAILGCFAAITPSRAAAQDKQPDVAATTPPSDQPTSAGMQSSDLSDEVVHDVLANLQQGMENNDLESVLDIFDTDDMKDYAQVHDQMVAFFRLHDSVKFRYQLLQVTAEKDLGFAIADIEMDADPTDVLPTMQRRSTQMRFQIKRSTKGWKVIGMRPMDFFNQ